MRLEKIQAKIERLKAQQAQAEAREKERSRRRRIHASIVAGALLMSKPEAFGLTHDSMRRVLDGLVKRPHDRRALDLDEQ